MSHAVEQEMLKVMHEGLKGKAIPLCGAHGPSQIYHHRKLQQEFQRKNTNTKNPSALLATLKHQNIINS